MTSDHAGSRTSPTATRARAARPATAAPRPSCSSCALWFALFFAVLVPARPARRRLHRRRRRASTPTCSPGYTSSVHPRDAPAPGRPSSGRVWVIDHHRAASPSRSASPPRSTSRSSPTEPAGTTGSSRSTCRTSPPCPRSSTACSPPAFVAADRPRAPARPQRRDRPGAADPAGHHHHHPGGVARGPGEIRAGLPRARGHAAADLWRQTLPSAVPGIATGTILALSRALGEAAPLLLLGRARLRQLDPNGLMSGSPRCRSRSSPGPSSPRRRSGSAAAADHRPAGCSLAHERTGHLHPQQLPARAGEVLDAQLTTATTTTSRDGP